nr:MAG TPA: hypothetical protein [Caudoviricetes sp.]
MTNSIVTLENYIVIMFLKQKTYYIVPKYKNIF